MSTPREQAMQAAKAAVTEFDVHPRQSHEIAADAASNVWEAREERLKGALRAAGVHERLVNEIADGGDPDGGLVHS